MNVAIVGGLIILTRHLKLIPQVIIGAVLLILGLVISAVI